MDKQEIIEGNKLIAEFLGSKFINDAPEDYPNGYYYQPEEIKEDCPTGTPDEWSFDSSWDWLMPVVEKVSTLTIFTRKYPVEVTIMKDFCLISYQDAMCEQTLVIKAVIRKDCKNTREAVWFAVVEFIKWYNKHEKS